MANLNDIIRWCDQTLASSEFKDYAPNGLQIEGRAEVNKILCAVTASQTAIEAAIEQGADLLLVHHGYFWKGEAYPITGMRGKRIKSLIQHDISLVGYHLPLDSHPTLGNNAAIADLLELENLEQLDPSERRPIGNIGYLKQAMTPEGVKAYVSERLSYDALHLPAEKSLIQKSVSVPVVHKIIFIKRRHKTVMLIFLAKSVNVLFMMLRNWMCIIMPAATTPLKNMVYNVWLKLFQNNLILSIVISN